MIEHGETDDQYAYCSAVKGEVKSSDFEKPRRPRAGWR